MEDLGHRSASHQGERLPGPFPFFLSGKRSAARLSPYGPFHDERLERDESLAAASREGRSGAVRRQAGAVPPPAAPHDRLAARPPAARPYRPFGRPPGDVPGGLGPADGVPAKADDALLPVAAFP